AVRNFCAECGSLLFGTPESAPEMVTIYVGSLDDSSLFAPTDAFFASQRPAWAKLAAALAEHAGLPKPWGARAGQAMSPTLDQFQGCLLGLALGDAMGAPHEGGPVERLVWKLIGKT